MYEHSEIFLGINKVCAYISRAPEVKLTSMYGTILHEKSPSSRFFVNSLKMTTGKQKKSTIKSQKATLARMQFHALFM